MGNNGFKKPNLFVYNLFRLISNTYGKLRYNIHKNKHDSTSNKAGFVLLCNHESSIDFFSVGIALKRRSALVISDSYYQTISIKKFLEKCRVIPKQQFQTSTVAMKKMKLALDNNLPLVMYPAGLMSADGISTPLPNATGKVMKWLGKDIYVGITKGSYLSNPKWGKVKRKGRIDFEIKKLLSKEDLEKYTNDELQDIIDKALYYDAYKNQLESPILFKNGDNLEGFESVLYKCPKCGKEFDIKVKGSNILECNNCHNEVRADKFGLFEKVKDSDVIYQLPSDWARYIKTSLETEIINNDNYSLSDECEIHIIVDNKYQKVGEGNISLDKKNITLSGVINGEETTKVFKTSTFITLPFVPNSRFEIQDGQTSYRIYLENPIQTTKWINSIEILYKLQK